MKLVIIAGGKGTRLGLTDIPKPMCKIGGIPILEHQVNLAKSYGITDIIIISGYLSEKIVDYFGDGRNFGVSIQHVIEEIPLGTAGCFNLIKDLLKERFMVFYADIMMNFDIKSFIDFDNKKSNSIGSILTHPNDHPYDSDLIEVKGDKVINFLTKPHMPGIFYSNIVNAAVYIFSPEIFKFINENKKQDFGKDVLPKVVKNGEYLRAYKTHEYIKDMGTLDRLQRVIEDYQSGKISRFNKKFPQKTIFIDRDGVINKDVGNLSKIEDFELLPGVYESIKSINQSEYLAVLITNQPVIAKGWLTEEGLSEIHKKMETLLGEKGTYLDAIYYCHHHPEKGFDGEVERLKIDCECRKPKPGMLFSAQKDINIDLKQSWMIGDSRVDVIAGKNAGCKSILVNNNIDTDFADYIKPNLKAAIDFILDF
ncbi:MAG: HAD-IIIA family hydrolase [Bacteroidales bacterium]|nr:HAD-IIIA family hydrolase [Bacteroidales bacterium]